MNFHQTLRLPIPQRYLEPQDGLQNAPRSVQNGSKRLLESNFFALENRLKFGLVLGAILERFWLPNPSQKTWGEPPPFCILKAFIFEVLFASLQEGPRSVQEAPKRPQEASRSAPRGPKRPPRALQEASRGPQETPRAGQEGSKPAQELPRASQDAHKAFPKHLVRQPFSEK